MRRKRSGYTLFQLLVLLAFLLILMAMLFPATLQVRAAAARMQSQNNLKQIGLAMHNYHDTMGRLPPGVDAKGFSGLALTLPYIEQDNLYKLIDFNTTPEAAGNAQPRAVMIKTYISPNDSPADLDRVAPANPKSGPTNYFLIAGSKHSLDGNDGVFFRDSKIKLTEMADGTSNTMMSLESLRGDGEKKAVSVQRQHVSLAKGYLKGLTDNSGVKDWEDGKQIAGTRGESWMEGKFLQSTINLTRKMNDEKPDVDCGGDGGLAAPRSTQGGTNVLMGDGSVRFVTSKTSLDTWKAAATRSGGEVLGPDF